jgi:hypothetical protein
MSVALHILAGWIIFNLVVAAIRIVVTRAWR